MNVDTLIAEILTFFMFLLMGHFVIDVISGGIGTMISFAFYNAKNGSTKVPMILELLAINPSKTLFVPKLDLGMFNFNNWHKIIKFDFNVVKNGERKLSREEC